MSRSSSAMQTEDNWRRRDPLPSQQNPPSSSSAFSTSANSTSARRFYGQNNQEGGARFGVSPGVSQKGFMVNGNGGVGAGRNERRLDLDKGREREREMEREQWRKAAVAAAAGLGGTSYQSNPSSFASSGATTGFPGGSPTRNRAVGTTDQSPSPATPLKSLHTGPTFRTSAPNGVDGLAHSENWALTPANSLPSLPGTPSRSHQTDFWGQRSNGAASKEVDSSRGSLRNASPRPPAHPSSTNASSRNAPVRPSAIETPSGLSTSRNSSPKLGNASSATFTSPTHPSLARVAATGSPKRSPLSLASSNQTTSVNSSQSRPAPLSPTSATKRSLSPATSPLLGSDLAAPASSSSRASIAYALSTAGTSTTNPQGNPPVSRRGSSNSLASIQGHSLTHSRRTSQIYSSAQSIASNGTNASSIIQTYGVYRPPHLRRDSVHALKPAVAHYDRIRTPSLRGQTRSRESSVSITSRAGSRPPSAVPFNHPNTIPEDGVTESRPRLGSSGSFLSGNEKNHPQQEILEEEGYFGNHHQTLDRPEGSSDQPSAITPKTVGGPDASELEAKLKEAGKRYPYQDQEVSSEEVGSQSNVARSEMTDDVDLSFEDIMNPSITESYCASRRGSVLGDAVDIFEVGDRLGPGMEHDGYEIKIAETSQGFRDQPEDIGLSGSQLEVVRKLGEGSYAVVYLVREVEAAEETRDRKREDGNGHEEDEGAFGPAEEAANDHLSLPVPSSKGASSASKSKTGRFSLGLGDESLCGTEGDRTVAAVQVNAEETYSSTLKASNLPSSFSSRDQRTISEPREFALKCLCKRDLSPEMLEVQRLEATIHQSIPQHPNIVTLYRTYETPEWLFLILEYCPGQDLYYWLEQAQDTAETGSTSASNSGEESGDESKEESHSLDATPPSPSLLASTAGQSLLSRKRLRLVASMFVQMCEAVQFCHDRGISHRDIKPENFIVEDRRALSSDGSDLESSFTRSESNKSAGGDSKVIVKLTDFGLASAEEKCRDFECGSKPYMAFETLNNVTDWYDPFQADTWSLGVVLLNIIFHRSPFSEPSVERCESFAAYCYDHIKFLMESFDGLSESAASFLADNVFCEVDTESETKSRITPREFAEWVKKLPDHLLASSSSGSKPVSGGYSEVMTHSLQHSRTNSMASTLPSILSSPGARHRELMRSLPSTFGNDEMASALRSDTPDILPTPSFSPTPPPLENEKEDDEPEEMLRDEEEVEQELGISNQEDSSDRDAMSPPNSESSTQEHQEDESRESHQEDGENAGASQVQSADPSETDVDSLRKPLSATSSNPKRRKRGARKGRTAAKLEQKQDLKRSQSVGQLLSLDDRASRRKHDRDAVIAELAAASQTLAREMSKATKNKTLSSSGSNSSLSGSAATSKLPPPAASPVSSRPQYFAPLAPIPPFVREPGSFAPESPTSQASRMHSEVHLKSKDSVDSTSSSSAFSKFSWDRSRTTSPSNTTAPPLSRGQSGEDSDFPFRDTSGSNWDSAASRRERMISHRKGPTLQDSGRSKPMSWREKNQSTTTLSSIASTNTVSSMSSISSDGSSIYSTASAPAALPRKSDSSSRHRTRGTVGPMGLGTIDERRKKEIDATYLATVFGGDPRQAPGSIRREKPRDSSSKKSALSSTTSEESSTTSVGRDISDSRLPSASSSLQRKSSSSTASIGQSSIAAAQEEKEGPAPTEASAAASKKSNPSGLAKFLRSVRSYNSNSST